MKIRKLYFAYLTLLLAAGFIAANYIQTNTLAGSKAIRLSLHAENESYALGEVIALRFAVTNSSGEPMAIARPGTGTGNIRLFVSGDGKNYSEYIGPEWGSLDAKRQLVKLDGGETTEVKATMLYNQRINTEHLTPLYADKINKERIGTEFAITEAGHYWLKATYTNEKDTCVSEPIELNVTEPVGTDAAVWEQIRSDGAFAYFLQTGDVRYMPGSDEALAFVEKMRSITTDYPNTAFAGRLSERIAGYDRNVESVKRLKAEHQTEN